jgi:hypothetical protein
MHCAPPFSSGGGSSSNHHPDYAAMADIIEGIALDLVARGKQGKDETMVERGQQLLNIAEEIRDNLDPER